MPERHPDDLDLLDLVEGDLPREAARGVRAHVDACSACAETVRELQAGRAALRTSARLELSGAARDAVTAAIDREPLPRGHRFHFLSPGRLGAIVAAALVLVASAVAVARWSDDLGGDRGGGEAGQALERSEDAAGGAGEEADAPTAEEEFGASPGAELARVAGPPRLVAAQLREQGFPARVENGRVVVRSPDGVGDELLRRYLETLEPGPVPVVAAGG